MMLLKQVETIEDVNAQTERSLTQQDATKLDLMFDTGVFCALCHFA
jgi:hypothetical protein